MGRLYTNSIMNAVNMIVSSWAPGVNSSWIVEVNGEYNTDPNKMPWIGIYSPDQSFSPFRAQGISPFLGEVKIGIITQYSDFASHVAAIENLSYLSDEVYTAVSCYRTLMGTVNIVKGIEIIPYDRVIDDPNNIVADKLTIIAEIFA